MRTIQFRSTQITFPNSCPVCLGATSEIFKIERTFTYGRRTTLINLPVQWCYKHKKLASSTTPAQRWCERLSPYAGAVFGLAVSAGLLWYWSASGQGMGIFNILLALIVGLCMGATLWAVGSFWVAPLFRPAAAKATQAAVRIAKYDPFRQALELTFENDIYAELTARENLQDLLLEAKNLRQYHISAHVLNNDTRFNGNIKTRVLLDHFPDEKEARDLLQPALLKAMAVDLDDGTFAIVDCIEVEEVGSPASPPVA